MNTDVRSDVQSTRCPDRQLLSVYFDGELPSPWKEKMEAHAAGCSRCARQLQSYRDASLKPEWSKTSVNKQAAAMNAAKERIWLKLESGIVENSAEQALPPRRTQKLWRRRVSIPIPAAAAILVIVTLAFLLVLRVSETAMPPGMTFVSETDFDTPGIIPVTNMEDVLQYLGDRDNSDFIILRLPESRSFVNYGEPSIVKAADYSRQTPNRARGK